MKTGLSGSTTLSSYGQRLCGSFWEWNYVNRLLDPIEDFFSHAEQDIPSLVHHFVRKKSRGLKLSTVPSLASGALERLLGYSWPGNVRELENVVERELILNPKETLRFAAVAGGQESFPAAAPDISRGPPLSLDELNASHIRRVLQATNGVVHGENGAAARLGSTENSNH
jgi:DNA-binding NtrC family response regulator